MTVDGQDVVDTPALLYPSPGSVVQKVRAYCSLPPSGDASN
ncbi:MAG TPA: hypothetical protein VHM24_01905 [Gemmatimonadaceae bacterium]|nr:hypothetical protein [Gemmatimonadaceae bacterium]